MDTTQRQLPRVSGALQAALGAVSLVGGLTWLLLNLHGPQFDIDLFVGGVFAAGGLVLLMPHRFRLPGRWSALVAAGTAVTGTTVGLVAATSSLCCMFAYATARGFPVHWVQRAAVAGDAHSARQLAQAANWQVDLVAMGVSLVFWGLLGLLLMACAVAGWRAVRDRVAARR